MNLFVYILPSFVQGYRPVERRCYMHTCRKAPSITGIGLPRQFEHSFFFFASQDALDMQR